MELGKRKAISSDAEDTKKIKSQDEPEFDAKIPTEAEKKNLEVLQTFMSMSSLLFRKLGSVSFPVTGSLSSTDAKARLMCWSKSKEECTVDTACIIRPTNNGNRISLRKEAKTLFMKNVDKPDTENYLCEYKPDIVEWKKGAKLEIPAGSEKEFQLLTLIENPKVPQLPAWFIFQEVGTMNYYVAIKPYGPIPENSKQEDLDLSFLHLCNRDLFVQRISSPDRKQYVDVAVHQGYLIYCDALLPKLIEFLKEKASEVKQLFIGGFSLGGAMSQIVAQKVWESAVVKNSKIIVCSIGAPRTGDYNWVSWWKSALQQKVIDLINITLITSKTKSDHLYLNNIIPDQETLSPTVGEVFIGKTRAGVASSFHELPVMLVHKDLLKIVEWSDKTEKLMATETYRGSLKFIDSCEVFTDDLIANGKAKEWKDGRFPIIDEKLKIREKGLKYDPKLTVEENKHFGIGRALHNLSLYIEVVNKLINFKPIDEKTLLERNKIALQTSFGK